MKPYSLNDEVVATKKLNREHTLRIREIVKEAKDLETAKAEVIKYAAIIPEFLLARIQDGAIEVVTPDTFYTFHYHRTSQREALSV